MEPQRQQPPELNLTTATHVLKQSGLIFLTHLPTFFLLSLLLLAFRSNVDNASSLLTSFVDSDPSLRPLLRRPHISPLSSPNPQHPRRRRPFLHLTRVGTLDDDFFSGQSSPLRPASSPPNSTHVFLSVKFSSYNDSPPGFRFYDNDIRVKEIVHPGLNFKLINSSDGGGGNDGDDRNDGDGEGGDERGGEIIEGEERERVVDLGFLVRGLELRRRDASALFFLVSLLSAAYGYVIAGFVVTYSWVLGIVFLVVVNRYLGKDVSFVRTVWEGSVMGIKRLSGFVLMKWAVRDALTQLLGLWYFGEIEDQYSFFKIFIRLKLMPFSVTSSWIKGFEKETAGFMFAWLLLDLVVEFVFALDSWVAIVDSRRTGREIVKEGCYLLSIMFKPAMTIKCLESILCGSYLKWSLSRYYGKLFGTAFQSLMEVYFIVTWLVFYFAVRWKEANSLGRTFGQRDLEGFIQGQR